MALANSTWEQHWRALLGISAETAQGVVAAGAILVILFGVIIPAVGVVSYLFRKLGADLQARVGPNQAGAAGFLQGLADLLKLLQKQKMKSEVTSAESQREGSFWYFGHTLVLYSSLAVLPLGSVFLFVNTDMSAFLPFIAALAAVLATLFSGVARGGVASFLGVFRVSAQAVAGAVPALFALLCAGLGAGGFRWEAMAKAQGFYPWSWRVFVNPFELLAFLVFFASGMVLLSIPPFSSAHPSSDLRGGVLSGVFGRRFAWLSFSRTYALFLWSLISVVMFLGAWNLPGFLDGAPERERWVFVLELIVVLSKTVSLMLLAGWIERASPRLRTDHVTDLVWWVFMPAALVALIGTALWERLWGGP